MIHPGGQGCPKQVLASIAATGSYTKQKLLIGPGSGGLALDNSRGFPWLYLENRRVSYAFELSARKVTNDLPSVKKLLEDLYTRNEELEYSRRVGAYHPSGLGETCLRKIAYERVGTRPEHEHTPDNSHMSGSSFKGVMRRGHAVHKDMQDDLESIAAEELDGRTTEWGLVRAHIEAAAISGALRITGHTDGVLVFRSGSREETWILEIKSSNKPWDKQKPDKDHVLQVHAYMIVHDVPWAMIIYVSPSNGYIKEHHIAYDPKVAKELLDKIHHIESLLEYGHLPDRRPSKSKCSNCGFFLVCAPNIEQ